eukprot:jgi/Phyca11/21889/fgenesh1_pg.PHYCAscaffold_190_\
MPRTLACRKIVDELKELGGFWEPNDPVNSTLKARLYPSLSQKEKLDQMFAANRAVHNKLDRVTRVATKGKNKTTQAQLVAKYRPIAKLKTMDKYKKGLARHRQVPDEVRDSAFRDFKRAVKSSIAVYFAKRKRGESTTYPDMKFKSGLDKLYFSPRYFGFEETEGIEVREHLPELTMSVRLQRLREGEYYLMVTQKKKFPRSKTERVCAIVPGVRNFVTVYDPNGRTLNVNDARSILKKKFEDEVHASEDGQREQGPSFD